MKQVLSIIATAAVFFAAGFFLSNYKASKVIDSCTVAVEEGQKLAESFLSVLVVTDSLIGGLPVAYEEGFTGVYPEQTEQLLEDTATDLEDITDRTVKIKFREYGEKCGVKFVGTDVEASTT